MTISELLMQRFSEFKDDRNRDGKPRMRSFLDKFLTQRKNVPKAHQLKNDTVFLSKKGIEALMEGNAEEFKMCREQCLEFMCDLTLLDLDLQPWLHYPLRCQAAQEFVEMTMCGLFYDHVIYGKDLPEELPDPFDLYAPLPAYLAGLQDCLSELSRLVTVARLDEKFSISDKIAMQERLKNLALEVRKVLFKEFNGVPSSIIDNGKVPFNMSFRGRLDGASGMVHSINERLAGILERIQVAREVG